jgi:hypothetical protein
MKKDGWVREEEEDGRGRARPFARLPLRPRTPGCGWTLTFYAIVFFLFLLPLSPLAALAESPVFSCKRPKATGKAPDHLASRIPLYSDLVHGSRPRSRWFVYS